MKKFYKWAAITFVGLTISIHKSYSMDVEDNLDSSDLDIASSAKRIYNLQPSYGTDSYNWIKSHESQNTSMAYTFTHLPEKYDFKDQIPYIHDQGNLGSCTAQAITLSMEYILKRNSPELYRKLSPLFVYYNERALEGTIFTDAGAVIADGIKTVCKDGACSEALWSYRDKGNKFKQKPPLLAYKDAKLSVDLDHIGNSNVPQELQTLKGILAQGIPIVFGCHIFSSFESDEVEKTGKIPMPKNRERKLGGHAMTLVGYNDRKKVFYLANSWGEQWGKKGFGTIPYDYITNPKFTFPDEFWKIETVGPKMKR
ncbi:MAG TPA: C1 family peptidase [Candidatus Nitrosotenuis sp.]|nr:C1 family peptidase [Candidatus Nitrosotenuis sp.]